MKSIVLDYGNVISEPQDIGCYDRMAALSGLTADVFRNAFVTHRAEYDRGAISGNRMYRNILAEAKVAGTEKDLAALASALLEEDIASWSRVSREVTEWGLSLKAAGHTLGVLSNMPFDFLNRYESRIELFAKADVSVFSCRESRLKPEPKIYRVLIERIGLDPPDIVFFDDVETNVEGARREGITAFLWTGLDQAKRDWEHVGTVIR